MTLVKTNAPRKQPDAPLTTGDVQKIILFCKSHLPRRIFGRCFTASEAMLYLSVSDMLILLELLGYAGIPEIQK